MTQECVKHTQAGLSTTMVAVCVSISLIFQLSSQQGTNESIRSACQGNST